MRTSYNTVTINRTTCNKVTINKMSMQSSRLGRKSVTPSTNLGANGAGRADNADNAECVLPTSAALLNKPSNAYHLNSITDINAALVF